MNTIQYKHIIAFTATLLLLIFGYFQADILFHDPLWNSYALPWQKTLPFLVAFAVYVCSYGLLRYKLSVIQHCVLFSGITIALVLGLNDSILLSLEWLLLLLAAWLFAQASCALLEFMSCKYRPLWLGFLVGMVLMHHIFFALALVSWLQLEIVYSFTVIICMIGGYRVFGQRPWNKWQHFLDRKIHFSDSIIIFSILLVAICTFIAASLPQTYVDGLVFRLPYLEHLKSFGGIPFHQYLWAWLIPQPTILLFAPAYYFLGEVGAAWSVLIFSFILGWVIFEFTRLFTKNDTASLLAVLVILANPIIWTFSTAVYNDIPIAAYSLAGLFLVIKAAQSTDYKLLTVAALLIGFACSIKLNAPIFLAASLGIIFVFSAQVRQLLLNPKVFITILCGLLAMLPWYIWVYLQTGNPLFPFLHDYLGTYDEFTAAATYSAEATKLFGFDVSLISILSLPWNLTFNTSSFGGYVNGTFGPSLIILLPLMFLGFSKRIRGVPHKNLPMLLSLVLAAMATVAMLVVAINMVYFRYILSAYILLVIVSIASFLFGKYVKIHWLASLTIGVFSILFLVSVGTRLNYAGGLGDEVYFGKQTRAEYINNITHGIQDYLNANLQADETVLTSDFFHVNRINTQTFFVSSKESLFGLVADFDKLKKFVKKNNVRYWVIDKANSVYHRNNLNIFGQYLAEDKIVYGSGNYVVYDLSGNPVKTLRTIDISADQLVQAKPLDAQRVVVDHNPDTHATIRLEVSKSDSLLKGKVSFASTANTACVIVDMIFYDSGGKEIHRLGATNVFKANKNNVLSFYTPVVKNAAKLLLIIRPWRDIDGQLDVKSVFLSLL